VASGKTTQLNAFSTFIKPDSKIVTVEDTPEIQLYHKNWLPSVTRQSSGVSSAEITLFDLMKASLRQRPDYLIVGEVRGEETYTLFQAMATGHLGMATMHADSLKAVIHRLETQPMNIPRVMISGLNLISIQARVELHGKPVRRTISVSEIFGLDPTTNEILTNELFTWEPTSDTYRFVGRSRLLEAYSQRSGVSMTDVNESIARRETILKWMLKKNILRFSQVTEIMRKFNSNPEAVYGSARSEL
jgi:flagellar protein FlaI